jgi:SRSO17 transposase
MASMRWIKWRSRTVSGGDGKIESGEGHYTTWSPHGAHRHQIISQIARSMTIVKDVAATTAVTSSQSTELTDRTGRPAPRFQGVHSTLQPLPATESLDGSCHCRSASH